MENFEKYFQECVDVAKDYMSKDNFDKSRWNNFVQQEIREHNAQQDVLDQAWAFALLSFYFGANIDEINKVKAQYRAEYENACEDLYYGYGYNFWLRNERNNGSKMSGVDAIIIWSLAFAKMVRY